MPAQRTRALWLCTFSFGVCFAVWVIFSIVGVELQNELGLSAAQFGLLVATPILTGSISRPLLGICSELMGARRVFGVLMLVVAGFTFALPYARSYPPSCCSASASALPAAPSRSGWSMSRPGIPASARAPRSACSVSAMPDRR